MVEFATIMLWTHVPYMAVCAVIIVGLLRLRNTLRAINAVLEVEHG